MEREAQQLMVENLSKKYVHLPYDAAKHSISSPSIKERRPSHSVTPDVVA